MNMKKIAIETIAEAISETRIATQKGQFKLMHCQATSAENVAISPCAKLTIAVVRNMRTNASPNSEYVNPFVIPFKN